MIQRRKTWSSNMFNLSPMCTGDPSRDIMTRKELVTLHPIENPTEINRRIEEMLIKDRLSNEKVVKLLLLGPSESGKSTILKQMKIIHLNGYTREELWARRPLIFQNLIDSMIQLLNGLEKLDLKLELDQEKDALLIRKYFLINSIGQNLPSDVVDAIKNLWENPKILRAFNKRNEFYLLDSAEYFLTAIDRIADIAYVPTIQDVLYMRVQTRGVAEISYNFNDNEFRIFDVGGEKTQRRKWIHLFDNVNAIFFIAAISEYDQFMKEDETMNRLHDALLLFKSIGNNILFQHVGLLLFLNKKDIFQEKINRVPLTSCFPNYKYKNDYKNAITYIQRKFEAQIKDPEKVVYTHLTCATDTNHVQFVMSSVTNMVMTKYFKGSGMM